MNDRVDQELTDHIRQTMTDYEAPYALGAWEQFERERTRSQRRLGVWFRYAAAACLLGGMLVAPLWLGDHRWIGPGIGGRTNEPPTTASVRKHINQHPTVLVQNKPTGTARELQRRPDYAASAAQRPVREPRLSAQPFIGIAVPIRPNTSVLPVDSTAYRPPILPVRPNNPAVLTEATLANTLPESPSLTNPTAATPLSVSAALAETTAILAESKQQRRRSVVWSVAVAPQSAYMQNSASALTLGGGFYSDIALSKRISLSTGLSLAQQQVGYAPPANRPVPLSGRQLVGTDARLITLDLPVNIRYQVGKLTKPLFHVSAGLSSIAFLGENYAYTYQVAQPILVTGPTRPTPTPQPPVQETQSVSAGAFQNIYWGRIVNVSVGVQRPLGDRFLFSVDPYLKYPIGSLTQENLRLGSAGVSFRLGVR